MTQAEKIYALETACFSAPWSITAVENQLRSENSVWLITEENNVPCGYALGSIVCGEAELYRIAVSPDFRRKGLGETILSDFIEKCRQLDGEKIFLEVRSRNIPAISLYKKAGFEEISVRKGYYGDDDAVIFAKILN
ncbi:MAG: ribosomal protein S18-alanine N-acetyltransferase [Ruminiclostridium sp.]|nr:ribosomal protein S18-alanine N-acetyltransferase [Ruminiclostridium sp.]